MASKTSMQPEYRIFERFHEQSRRQWYKFSPSPSLLTFLNTRFTHCAPKSSQRLPMSEKIRAFVAIKIKYSKMNKRFRAYQNSPQPRDVLSPPLVSNNLETRTCRWERRRNENDLRMSSKPPNTSMACSSTVPWAQNPRAR